VKERGLKAEQLTYTWRTSIAPADDGQGLVRAETTIDGHEDGPKLAQGSEEGHGIERCRTPQDYS